MSEGASRGSQQHTRHGTHSNPLHTNFIPPLSQNPYLDSSLSTNWSCGSTSLKGLKTKPVRASLSGAAADAAVKRRRAGLYVTFDCEGIVAASFNSI